MLLMKFGYRLGIIIQVVNMFLLAMIFMYSFDTHKEQITELVHICISWSLLGMLLSLVLYIIYRKEKWLIGTKKQKEVIRGNYLEVVCLPLVFGVVSLLGLDKMFTQPFAFFLLILLVVGGYFLKDALLGYEYLSLILEKERRKRKEKEK